MDLFAIVALVAVLLSIVARPGDASAGFPRARDAPKPTFTVRQADPPLRPG